MGSKQSLEFEAKKKLHGILLISDDSETKQFSKEHFGDRYTWFVVDSIEEGKQQLQTEELQQNVQIIILDEGEHLEQSVEFFILAHKVMPLTRCILLAQKTDKQRLIAALNEGQIHKYLSKPFEKEKFGKLLAQTFKDYQKKLKQEVSINTRNQHHSAFTKRLALRLEMLEQEVQDSLSPIQQNEDFIEQVALFLPTLSEQVEALSQSIEQADAATMRTTCDRVQKSVRNINAAYKNLQSTSKVQAATKDLEQ